MESREYRSIQVQAEGREAALNLSFVQAEVELGLNF